MGMKLKKVAKAAKDYRHILIVMRHAKAESLGKASDRDRNLTDKGLKQAKTVAKGLVELDLVPDRIACSGAARALQTCERMLKTFGDHPAVDYRQSLYESGARPRAHGVDQLPVVGLRGFRSVVVGPAEPGSVDRRRGDLRLRRAVRALANPHRPPPGRPHPQGLRLIRDSDTFRPRAYFQNR